MPAITQREIEASYDLAKQVYENQIKAKDAVEKLVNKYKMNKGSAKMSIDFFQELMKENIYKITLSESHIEYYLENILRDYGKEKLKKFLRGLKKHIEHRNAGLRKLHYDFSAEIGLKSDLWPIDD